MVEHARTTAEVAHHDDEGAGAFGSVRHGEQIGIVVWPRRPITQSGLDTTYVIAGGYTAGHLTPGLAVAEEFHRRHPHVKILIAGWTDPAEEAFVRHSGLSFLPLPASPWASQGSRMRGRSLTMMLPAIWVARRRFRAAGAVGLLSLGSFAAFAPALAARSLGLPLTVFEPNFRFGLANRMLVPLAEQVLVSKLFDAATRPRPERCEIVGVPLRSAFQALAGRRPNPPAGPAHLLVLGGSLGNPFFNARAPGLARRLAGHGLDLHVTHQCGRNTEAAPVRAAYTRAGVRAVVEPFFDPINPVLASADFVLTSAGAITLHEIAAAGIPLLVTPLRAGAAAHQYANAETFGQATGCLVRTEEAWAEADVAQQIASILGEPERWRQQSVALQAFAEGDARVEVVNRIVASVPALSRCL